MADPTQTLGPDYDARDLIATITASYPGTGTSDLFPLLFEGIPSFFVPVPFNFHLGFDDLNFVNNSPDAVTISIQVYQFTTGKGAPYGVAGPVVFSEILNANSSLDVDGTRFRRSIGPGFFFVAFAIGIGISATTPVQVQGRARFTPG